LVSLAATEPYNEWHASVLGCVTEREGRPWIYGRKLGDGYRQKCSAKDW
jgi:hypothetical protein